MLKKTFGLVAIAALAVTFGFSTVKAMIAADTIWVYPGGETTSDPMCDTRIIEECAYLHEYNGGVVGAPILDVNGDPVYLEGKRIFK